MFGKKFDYYFLKLFTHKRMEKEEDLMEERSSTEFKLEDVDYLDRIQLLLGKKIPIDKSLSYLDIGCGMGRLSIGLSLRGAKDVTGIEISDRKVTEAKIVSLGTGDDPLPSFIRYSRMGR